MTSNKDNEGNVDPHPRDTSIVQKGQQPRDVHQRKGIVMVIKQTDRQRDREARPTKRQEASKQADAPIHKPRVFFFQETSEKKRKRREERTEEGARTLWKEDGRTGLEGCETGFLECSSSPKGKKTRQKTMKKKKKKVTNRVCQKTHGRLISLRRGRRRRGKRHETKQTNKEEGGSGTWGD